MNVIELYHSIDPAQMQLIPLAVFCIIGWLGCEWALRRGK